MPRHSSYRSSHGMDSMGTEWSTSQLVIGIAVAIVFGATCFATGYVIAMYDRPLGEREVLAAVSATEGAPEAATSDAAPAQKPATDVAGDAAPRKPVALPPSSAPSASSAPAATPVPAPTPTPAPEPVVKPSETIQRPGFRPTTIEPLPEPGSTPMVRSEVDLNKAPAPEVHAAAPGKPAAPADATAPEVVLEPMEVAINSTPVPAVTPPTTTAAPVTAPITPPAAQTVKPPVTAPVTPPVTPPAAAPTVTPPKPKPAPAPTVTKGSFGIQVAAFDGPQRVEQAKEVQRNLKANAQQNAEIIITADGAYHKVVVTGFSTRDEAKAACEKLKSKPGLSGAWVVRL